MSFHLSKCVGFVLNYNAKKLKDEFEKRLREKNTTREQWVAQYFINEQPGITQKLLAEKMNVKEPSMARLIDRMKKNDLVFREENKQDRRENMVFLTPKGDLSFKMIKNEGEKFCDELTRDITDDELACFSSVLEKMVKNIL